MEKEKNVSPPRSDAVTFSTPILSNGLQLSIYQPPSTNTQNITSLQDCRMNSRDFKEKTKCVVGNNSVATTNYPSELLNLLGMTFKSREELLCCTKSFYSKQGYALSIKNSKKEKYLVLGCDRGGTYRDKRGIPLEDRKRKSGTRLINCPFEVRGKKNLDGFWVLKMKNSSHNHEASFDMSGHPSCRRLSKEQIFEIEKLTKAGVQPRQILSALRNKNVDTQAVSKTIYNVKTKIKKEALAGRTDIEVLFDELGQGNFIYDVDKNDKGKVRRLFFAHPITVTLSRSYPTVFVMDCTYKTNRYERPLLDIIGMSSFNTTFYSCFAFLENEKKEDYIWALKRFRMILEPEREPSVIVSDREFALMNAIEVVFPKSVNLLCVWHIERNVLAKCKRYFEVQQDWEMFLSAWNNVIHSPTEIEYEKAWTEFELLYKEKQVATSYIKDMWLPHKERFIDAWTEKHLHFGSRVSSEAESAHAKLEQYLHVSKCDFRKVRKDVCLAIENDFQEIKTRLSSEQIQTLHCCNFVQFKELNTRVSQFALKELYKQWELVTSGKLQPNCTGQFKGTMGLPCAHMLREWKGKVIPLDAIHSQWRIDNRQLIILDSVTSSDKEKLKGLLGAFEEKYLFLLSIYINRNLLLNF